MQGRQVRVMCRGRRGGPGQIGETVAPWLAAQPTALTYPRGQGTSHPKTCIPKMQHCSHLLLTLLQLPQLPRAASATSVLRGMSGAAMLHWEGGQAHTHKSHQAEQNMQTELLPTSALACRPEVKPTLAAAAGPETLLATKGLPHGHDLALPYAWQQPR